MHHAKQQRERMSPPGLPQPQSEEPAALDYEWLQQQLASAVQLADDEEEDGAWVDPTPDGLLSEALEACELGDAPRLRGLLDKVSRRRVQGSAPATWQLWSPARALLPPARHSRRPTRTPRGARSTARTRRRS
jgi:hypothetical protein